MKFKVDGIEYDVIIQRKNNKNTYIRVKEDLKIYVTTNYFINKKQVFELLSLNYDFVSKNLKSRQLKNKENELFYYLGEKYDIIFYENKNVEIYDNRIYVSNLDQLNKWYKLQIKKIFQERLDYNYNLFKEKIPYPTLRLRKMKTRWGVCNRKLNTVTLNTELIKYTLDKLDYVIIHELSHFVHFNHSSLFWEQVEKYCPDYKKIRKELKS